MSSGNPVRRIAIVGTGVIGASWAAYYLSRGFDVVATDPAANAEGALRRYVDEAWVTLTQAGLSAGASRERLSFTPNLAAALSEADFVQENAPERPDFKAKLFADMDAASPADAILASSSSSITMDVIQSACKRPQRCVIGHPFNPPHVIPLVEVVGGAKTSRDTLERAMAFYASIGKKPIRLHKALPGHVANRLQAALYKEVLYLIQQGVLSVADADAAVCYGPGLRWGVMGPSLQWHVGGGQGGISHFMEHLMAPLEGLMKALGTPDVTPALKRKVVDAVLEEASGRSVDQLAREENEVLIGLLALRAPERAAAVSGRLFFLDLGGGRVLSANPDGSDLKTVVEEGRKLPDGLVVDVAAGHLYWTNMGNPKANDGSILRSNLDGSHMTTIIAPGGTFTPKQIQLDQKNGKIYWSDREGMRVMRANLDGSQVETLVDTSQGDPHPGADARKWCVGIAVDADGGKIYWTQKGGDNAGEGRICRANINIPRGQNAANRQDVELLFDALPEPIDLDLDVPNRLLYWTDRGNPPRGNTVNRASMDPVPGQVPEILFSNLMEGIGLALDLKGGRMFVTDFAGSVYSANLDGSNQKTLLFAQGNLTGIAYVELPAAR
jgi:3-hydroxyacyl-CoA dehydrogenase/DNA-binding beta-propeller fold protein YncE